MAEKKDNIDDGGDPLEVWCVTDEKQLSTITLPNPNKIPCEANVVAIRAFLKRGLKITRLALAWWLTFNVQFADQVQDIITIEDAIDVGIRARVPQIIMILPEYVSEAYMLTKKADLLKWHEEARAAAAQENLKRTLNILEPTLIEMGWVQPSQ